MPVKDEYPLREITEWIIGAAFRVRNRIGQGFQEKVYENARVEELLAAGLKSQSQKPLQVVYGGKPVGIFVADLLVVDSVLVELEAKCTLDKSNKTQLINYLKASGIAAGLLLHFGESVQVRRRVFSDFRQRPSGI